MAGKITAPRGTRDLLPEEGVAWNRIEGIARDLSDRYAFDRIDIPLFERVELFARGLGESSDAVEKEMFRVSGAAGSDEARADWALRPEPTAGIVRAYIEHGMHVRPGPLRLWMLGPMFRYDRPQAGRYRQFTQWDVEVLGDPGPMVDAELIELAHRFYAEAGITDAVAYLNSIGDATCRPGYRQALVDYFGKHADRLSDDSRRRLRSTRCASWTTGSWIPSWQRAHHAASTTCAMPAATTSTPSCACSTGWACATRSTRPSSAAWTTTREPRSSSSWPIDVGSSRRWPVAAATTAWQSSLADARQRESASGWASTGPSWHCRKSAWRSRRIARWWRWCRPIRRSSSRGCGWPRQLRDEGLRVRPDGSERKLGRQLEAAAKVGAHWAVIVGEELERGRVMLRDLDSGEQRDVSLDEVPRIVSEG